MIVAETRSYDDTYLPGTRMLWSALVPITDLEALKGQLIAFNYEVESTGRPGMSRNIAGSVDPRFWFAVWNGESHGI